ncbi:hypothetical protein Tco_0475895 [Tanacetum coccineum]
MMVQQVLNLVVERLLMIVEEQLVLDMMIDGKLVGNMIIDEPLVFHISYVVEEVNRIVKQLVKAIGDTVMDCYSMEESYMRTTDQSLYCACLLLTSHLSQTCSIPAEDDS